MEGPDSDKSGVRLSIQRTTGKEVPGGATVEETKIALSSGTNKNPREDWDLNKTLDC